VCVHVDDQSVKRPKKSKAGEALRAPDRSAARVRSLSSHFSLLTFIMATTAATSAFMKARVLSGYRRLFRARKGLFHGDNLAMIESRKAIRSEFEKNRYLQPATLTTLEPYLIMIDEAVDMLQNAFARGKLNPASGNYGAFLLYL